MKTPDSIQSTHTVTWWLTGLLGAGRTTLGEALTGSLRSQEYADCQPDGDDQKKEPINDLGCSLADSEEHRRKAAWLASLLNSNAVMTIVPLVSPGERGRAVSRQIIGNSHFVENDISTNLHVCQERVPKDFYAQANPDMSLQLTGVSAPYEAPVTAECVIDTSQTELITAIQQRIHF